MEFTEIKAPSTYQIELTHHELKRLRDRDKFLIEQLVAYAQQKIGTPLDF